MDKDILYRFFAGIATYDEEEDVCRWVNNSETHRKEFVRERAFFDRLLLHKPNMLRLQQNKTKSLPLWIGEAFKVTAVASVLLLSLFTVRYFYTNKSSEQQAINRVLVPPGQRVNLLLADGTTVWLNACSEFAYPASFTEKKREVSLKGQAYFEVTKDEKHPFIVKTSHCEVQVLGTSLDVRDEENDFAAALFEGFVQLKDLTQPENIIRLQPMQQAIWKEGGLQVESVQDLNFYRWREGLICFDNICFIDLMKRFEKIYDIQIIVQNPTLQNFICSGKCRTADGIDFILQVLQRSRPFTFVRNEENTTVYIK